MKMHDIGPTAARVPREGQEGSTEYLPAQEALFS